MEGRPMHVYRVVWEDATKNRDVEITIDYRVDQNQVAIDKITPTKVTVYDADRETVAQVLPVTRPTGQRILTAAFFSSREGLPSIEQEILEQHLAV
jgi:hypothetical protein